MAVYGLDGIDRNMRAYVALMGLSENPSAVLADLFQSRHPIEPLIRRLLAEAFQGRSRSLTVSIKNSSSTKTYHKLKLRLKRIQSGKEMISELNIVEKESEINNRKDDFYNFFAEKFRVSTSSVMQWEDYAKKCLLWISDFRQNNPAMEYSDDVLELAFAYADAKRQPPESLVKDSLTMVRQMLDWIAQQQEADISRLGKLEILR